jgi:hypothetical protein
MVHLSDRQVSTCVDIIDPLDVTREPFEHLFSVVLGSANCFTKLGNSQVATFFCFFPLLVTGTRNPRQMIRAFTRDFF